MAFAKNIHQDNMEYDRASDLVHTCMVWFATTIFVVLLVWQMLHGRPASLQLHFNGFAVLSIISLISNVIAFVLVLRIKRRSEVLVWFSAFLLSVAAWAAGEAMTRLSATPEAVMFWAPISTPGSVFMPITLYMFTLTYTRPKYALRPFALPIMLAVAALFVYLDNHTNLIALYTDTAHLVSTPWGYMAGSGSAFGLITLWAMLFPAACIFLLNRFRKQAIDPTLRKQAQLFMIAIAIPLVGGSITDGIFPILGLTILPPLSVMLLTVMGAIISYGVFKYRFFSITPSLIANEILGTMNEAVIGVQPNFRINFVNTGAQQLFGLTAKQLSNRRLSEFWAHHPAHSKLEDKIADVLGKYNFGTIESIEFRTPAGVIFTAKLSVTKLNDETQPYGYLIVMTDITELAKSAAIIEHEVAERTKELHEEQAKLRASIDSLSLGFMLVDGEDAIAIQNRALKKILGFKHAVGTLQEVSQLISGMDLAKECSHVRKSHRATEIKEVSVGTKVLHLFIAPVRIQERGRDMAIGTVVLVQDITEEKVLARSRDEFFSIASHELRTPLTSIKGNASMMIDYYKELLDKDASFREMVFDIHTSSSRLIDIVGDFLDVSRIEQGKMVFRPQVVDLDKIIEFVFYEMRAILREKSISLESNIKTLGVLPKVWADKDRLTQIIYNLVGNAVKFTEKGGVTVDVKHDIKYIQLRVTDTGRGMSLENQKMLFHKFQQAGDSLLTRDTTRGTGLGLYISKLMIENMGGSIELEKSEEGVGSTFLVTIPIATKEQLASKKPAVLAQKIDTATGLSKN